MSFMHYQNSTTYFHRVCIQSGIVRKKLGLEARCYIVVKKSRQKQFPVIVFPENVVV
jgi:hypothetical protein